MAPMNISSRPKPITSFFWMVTCSVPPLDFGARRRHRPELAPGPGVRKCDTTPRSVTTGWPVQQFQDDPGGRDGAARKKLPRAARQGWSVTTAHLGPEQHELD